MAQAIIIAGLGFGDEGKGTIVDYLARTRPTSLVVRYCGGAQAAHNVITPDGRHHTFSQFGSGTFVPGCQTHLSRFMMVNPIFMQAEEKHLQQVGVTDAYARTTIERGALVTTPFHVAANRCREMVRDALLNARRTGAGRHGSCGMGVGETMSDAIQHPHDVIRVHDLVFKQDDFKLRRKLKCLQEIKQYEVAEEILKVPVSSELAQEWSILNDTMLVDRIIERFNEWKKRVCFMDAGYLRSLLSDMDDKTVIFEGAQGVLLDENYGFHPHTTWSTTTFRLAEELLRDTGCKVQKIGVLRAYQTRHGAGPMPTEDAELTARLPELHNSGDHAYQQGFRCGAFDTPLLRYAMQVAGPVDEIAMTHLDRVPDTISVCTYYQKGLARMSRIPDAPYAAHCGVGPYLAAQQEIGRMVGLMEPVVEPMTHDAFLQHVEEAAGCPITICGYGPTASDKRTR